MTGIVSPLHEAQMNPAELAAVTCFVEAVEAWAAAERAAWEVGRSGSRQAGATETDVSDEEVA